jgi:hypothetical protein
VLLGWLGENSAAGADVTGGGLAFGTAGTDRSRPVIGTYRRASALISPAQRRVDVMQMGYVRPFSFQIGRRPETGIGQRPETRVSSVRHGVTEIALSDRRLVRATLHVNSVKVDPKKPGAIDVSYNIVAEVIATPDMPISDVHETVQ